MVDRFDLKDIEYAVAELQITRIEQLIKDALEVGATSTQIIGALRCGVDVVGKRYEAKEYYISELVIAGEVMRRASVVLDPYLKAERGKSFGRVILGSALGDMHDIGKNIVKTVLSSAGFEVYDLGVDVTPEAFVQKAQETGATIIAISALLSTTVPVAKEVVETMKKAGIRDHVKVILGGAAVRSTMIKAYGVDAAVNDAFEGLTIIKSWIKNPRPKLWVHDGGGCGLKG